MGFFNRGKEDIQILEKAQNNLDIAQRNMDITQKNVELMVSMLTEIIESKKDNIQDINIEPVYTEEEKKRAAYALNLCMVSVSQIIDYNDPLILEQEYECILNNLNLENMPKDEALLNTLKILLDTITFFRIAEGDKKFIEKDYQDKMKNAIWSAVPNIGVIVASGNPIAMGVSLASQVGIGYMNYRKNKAQNIRDKEKNMWEIQKSAIEQFNGIRRELFDTAWRLSDKYKFNDEYRLTERRIKQYNDILMDPDAYRRFERLDYISDKFEAYPPFWYYHGQAANEIAGKEEDFRIRKIYIDRAKQSFEKYLSENTQVILREDHILSACCLEYIDLLDVVQDKDKINGLLNRAVKSSGESNDILQLCSMYYMKIGDMRSASPILRRLVNEGYNITVNAQLLSKIYVQEYIEYESMTALSDYRSLKNRVDSSCLFPMPNGKISNPNMLNIEFLKIQRQFILRKYELVLEEFIKKYTSIFNKIIPNINPDVQYNESDYLEDITIYNKRIKDIKEVLNNQDMKDSYLAKLADTNISFAVLDVLNRVLDAILSLKCIEDKEVLVNAVESRVIENKEYLNSFQKLVNSGELEKNLIDIIMKINFKTFTEELFSQLITQIVSVVDKSNSMEELVSLEQNLMKFCMNEKIEEPVVKFKDSRKSKNLSLNEGKVITHSLLGEDALKQKQKIEFNKLLVDKLIQYRDSMILKKDIKILLIKGESSYEKYINDESSIQSNEKVGSIIGVIKNTSFIKGDLILTENGIHVKGIFGIKKIIPYKNISWYDSNENTLDIDGKYKNEYIDQRVLYNLIQELAKIRENIRYN